MGFVDDISLLTYSKSTERNVQNLEKAYKKCLNWAKTHGSRFNPDKSELIHFKRGRKGVYNIPITLENEIVKPSESIRLLGVYLDQSLTYKAHLKALYIKIPTLLSALRSIISLT